MARSRSEAQRLLLPPTRERDSEGGGTFGSISDPADLLSNTSAASSRCASPFGNGGMHQSTGSNRMRSWSGGRRRVHHRHSLENYDFNKPEWVNLDMFQSMSAVLRQDLYLYEGPLRGKSAFYRLWSIVQTPILVVSVGAITGLLGLFVAVSDRKLLPLRWMWLTLDPAQWYWWVGYAVQSMCLALLACALTQYFCPSATGGGIPEIKTVLSGAINPGLLSTRLVVVKLLGLVLAKAAGLSVGKEGPLVHAACAVAEVLMTLGLFRSVRVAADKRLEMLACACAAGVAASFGSAFGATLFSVEVTATAYLVDALPRSFMAAVTVVLVFWVTGTSDLFALFSEAAQAAQWESSDLLAWAALGVLCGLLGCAFVACVDRLSRWRNFVTRKALGQRRQRRRRFLVVAFFTAIVIPISYLELIYYDGQAGVAARPHALVDEMFQPRSFGLSLHLALYVPLKFVQTMFSVTQPLPVGLFSPVFLMGSAIGRVFGETLRYLEKVYGMLHINFEPWEFALIGSAAFSAGVTRAVSTAVIVFELSGENHLRLPLGVALLLAYMIGNRFTKDIYESLIDQNTLPWLPAMPPEAYTVEAQEVMIEARKLPVVALNSTYEDALQLLHHHKEHASIPVVQRKQDMLLVGSILRHDLEVAVEDFESRIFVPQHSVVLGRSAAGSISSPLAPLSPPAYNQGMTTSPESENTHSREKNGGEPWPWPADYSPRQAAAGWRFDLASRLRNKKNAAKGNNQHHGNGRSSGNGSPASGNYGNGVSGSVFGNGAAALSAEDNANGSGRGVTNPQQQPQQQQQHGAFRLASSPRRRSPRGRKCLLNGNLDLRRSVSGGYPDISPAEESRVIEENKDVALQFIVIKGGNKFVPVVAAADEDEDAYLFQRRVSSGAACITVVLDPSPYQVMHTTELRRVDLAFRMLKLDLAWVCQAGRLTGLITRGCLRRFIGKRDKRPLDDCRRLCETVRDYCCFDHQEAEVVGIENFADSSDNHLEKGFTAI